MEIQRHGLSTVKTGLSSHLPDKSNIQSEQLTEIFTQENPTYFPTQEDQKRNWKPNLFPDKQDKKKN